MVTPENKEFEWQPCADGVLQEFAVGERTRKRRAENARLWNTIGRSAIVLMAGVSLGFLIAYFPGKPPSVDKFYGGIACSAVRSNASSFWSFSVDDPTRLKMLEHMKSCQACQEHVESFRKSQASNRNTERFVWLVPDPQPGFIYRDWLRTTMNVVSR